MKKKEKALEGNCKHNPKEEAKNKTPVQKTEEEFEPDDTRPLSQPCSDTLSTSVADNVFMSDGSVALICPYSVGHQSSHSLIHKTNCSIR